MISTVHTAKRRKHLYMYRHCIRKVVWCSHHFIECISNTLKMEETLKIIIKIHPANISWIQIPLNWTFLQEAYDISSHFPILIAFWPYFISVISECRILLLLLNRWIDKNINITTIGFSLSPFFKEGNLTLFQYILSKNNNTNNYRISVPTINIKYLFV